MKKICNRVLAVLLCISVFCTTFVTTAFAGAAELIGGVIAGFLENLLTDITYNTVVGDFFNEGQESEYIEMDKDNYKKFADNSQNYNIPINGDYVSVVNTDGVYKLMSPFLGYPDYYISMYRSYSNTIQIAPAYMHFYKSGTTFFSKIYYVGSSKTSELKSFDYSSFSDTSVFDYISCKMLTNGSMATLSFYSTSSLDGFNRNIFQKTLPSSFTWSFSDFFNVSGVAPSGSALDYGLIVSHTPLSDPFLDPADVPEGSKVLIPKNANSFSELRTFSNTPSDDTPGGTPSGGGGLNGDNGYIVLGGTIDVNLVVPDINVNVNVNHGNSSEDPNDYIDPGEVDTNLDTYLQHIPEVSKNFIDYLKDFFEWLPPPVFGILMLGLIVAVWCRLAGR